MERPTEWLVVGQGEDVVLSMLVEDEERPGAVAEMRLSPMESRGLAEGLLAAAEAGAGPLGRVERAGRADGSSFDDDPE